ncbi:MAG: putative lipid II flippase FtsW [Gammaproteobacteria bacterium]|nr:putative lipid II flippase FtsW [Gammaproteobacteria bacterium]
MKHAIVAQRTQGVVLAWGQNRFYVDTLLLLAASGLLILGFIMVSSASLHLGDKFADDSFFFPKHQFAHILAGFVLALTVAAIKIETWQKSSLVLFGFGILLLLVVLIPGLGTRVNGAIRWLNFFGVRIQVSEVFKLIAVIYVASYLTRHLDVVRCSVLGMVYPLALLSIACGLLLMEPDFGASAVIMATALGMLFVGGARLWPFGVLMALVLLSGVALVFSAEYRLKRVLSFLDPWADPLNTGFQLTQALIAFGRGEWTGVGLGSSVQKLFYLPEAHTDFLFSVIGEELGLMGACAVILLFAVVVWRAFAIGRLAEGQGMRFGAFLAYGIGIWFGLQAFINMGVNMGMLPTKGLTLPLMSYGGGSMIVTCAALALLLRVRSEAVERRVGGPRVRTTWARA